MPESYLEKEYLAYEKRQNWSQKFKKAGFYLMGFGAITVFINCVASLFIPAKHFHTMLWTDWYIVIALFIGSLSVLAGMFCYVAQEALELWNLLKERQLDKSENTQLPSYQHVNELKLSGSAPEVIFEVLKEKELNQ